MFPRLWLVSLLGCGPAQPPTFTELSTEIFAPSCIEGGCHGAATGAGNLFLEGERSYESVVSTPCEHPAAIEGGLVRITPGDAERSFFYQKLVNPAGMGEIMPPESPLSDAELARVAAWIEAGALRE